VQIQSLGIGGTARNLRQGHLALLNQDRDSLEVPARDMGAV